jgi:hypothetical protein
MRIDVYNGWIELRDPAQVPERLRRPVVACSSAAAALEDIDENNISTETITKTLEFYSEFNDLLAVAMVESWSWSMPVSTESLLELPSRAYDDIRKAVAPYVRQLLPDFSVSGVDDPLVPTVS